MWHEHANLSASEDVCLFSFNDLPVRRRLAWIARKRSMITMDF
jgi:gentisate 1,2-dioxygenase